MTSEAKPPLKRAPCPERKRVPRPPTGRPRSGSAGFRLLGLKAVEREAQELTDARVLLLRVTLEHRALVGTQAHRHLAVRIAHRLAVLEIEFVDRQPDDLARCLEPELPAVDFDSGDQ